MNTKASIGYDNFGSYVEWYTDDDDASGYGDNPRVARWYALTSQCYSLAKRNPPTGCKFMPIGGDVPQPGSAAWCEVQADNH